MNRGIPPRKFPPLPPLPKIDAFTEVTSDQLAASLGQDLIEVADSIRDIATEFGLRPYKISVVKTRWLSSNGTTPKRGWGIEVPLSTIPLLPTPMLTDMNGVAQIVTPIGLDEFGEVLITEISGRLREETLRGYERAADGTVLQIPEDVSFYYEIEFPTPGFQNQDGERRRFSLKGAPMYFADKFQWQVRLERQRRDRKRNGDP